MKLKSSAWQLRDRTFEWGQRTYLMGILNVTPDSFSDGGQFNTLNSALEQAQRMAEAGADILDIGGQSTRPGAEQITLEAEIERVIPIIQTLRQMDWMTTVPISVDTTRAEVAKCAIAAGADIINDISGGMFEPEILSVAAALNVPIILMHMRGTPQTMQQMTDYTDLVGDIAAAIQQQVETAIAADIKPEYIALDPGIGFAKTAEQNIKLLRHLPELRALGYPLLVGTSRKSFIGKIINQPDPQRRIWGTAATCCAAIANSADILRVHDVAEMADVCKVADAIWRQ
ncbi:MAG: dihydropteroate synthase [Thainema sp.]